MSRIPLARDGEMVGHASTHNHLGAVFDVAEGALTIAQVVTTDIWGADPEMSMVAARNFMVSNALTASPLRGTHSAYIYIDDLQARDGCLEEVARPIEGRSG